jgi:arginase family enzyme
VYDELADAKDALVIQLDAHLDVYNLSDCTAELSHGNFLLHAAGKLPALVNLGSRELLLPAAHVQQYYRAVFPAADLAIDPEPALKHLRQAGKKAKRVFIDVDCDVFEPACFPAVGQPVPFGLPPAFLLRVLAALEPGKLAGLLLSEFDPARDERDRSLETLMWLIEYVLLELYEKR